MNISLLTLLLGRSILAFINGEHASIKAALSSSFLHKSRAVYPKLVLKFLILNYFNEMQLQVFNLILSILKTIPRFELRLHNLFHL